MFLLDAVTVGTALIGPCPGAHGALSILTGEVGGAGTAGALGAFTIEPAEILPCTRHHGAPTSGARGMDGRALLITGAFGIACSFDLETETIATSSMETLTLQMFTHGAVEVGGALIEAETLDHGAAVRATFEVGGS